MKKVLVIGATGMQGRHLVPLLLKKGYAVDGVTLDNVTSSEPNLRYFQMDATDDAVLRALIKNGYGGIVDFLHYDDLAAFKARMPMLLENTGHYIFVSSYRTCADSAEFLTESSPRLTESYKDDSELLTKDTYGVAKCRGEDLLNASGYKNYSIVRPVVVYAENCVLLVTWKGRMLPYRAEQGKKLPLPIEAKDKQAAIIYAGDIARLYAEVLFNEKAFGQTYTFGSPEPITWGEMARLYEKLCGVDLEWISGDDFAQILSGNSKNVSYGMKFMLEYDRYFNRKGNVDKVMNLAGLAPEDFVPHAVGIERCVAAYPADYVPSKLEQTEGQYVDDYFKAHEKK